MNNYLRHLIVYFESVLHPASGWADGKEDKKKRRTQKQLSSVQPSPDSMNMRAVAKKGEKMRRNPAP